MAEAEALRQRGYLATKQGDYPSAVRLLEESLTALRDTGRRRSLGLGLGHLAQTLLYLGQVDRAVAMLEEALDHLEAVDHGTGRTYFLNVLGLARDRQGNRLGAAAVYRRCLASARATGYRWAIAESLIGIGALAVGEPAEPEAVRTAVTLLAASDALLRRIDYAIPLAERAFMDRLLADLRDALTPGEYAAAWAAGGRLSSDDAVALGMVVCDGVLAGPSPVASTPADPGRSRAARRAVRDMRLSRREEQVAVLVAEGRTNREIAETLGISEKTAGAHVQHILNKLGVNSRAQIAAWAVARGLLPPPT